jgi:hypothetical protein
MQAADKRRPKGLGNSAARKRAAPTLVAALAEAGWAEADASLADALSEFDTLQSAVGARARDDAVALLGQALARAARKRGLARFGALDALEPYDPKRHQLEKPAARTPKRVRIRAQGVARGNEVLIKARVAAVRESRT